MLAEQARALSAHSSQCLACTQAGYYCSVCDCILRDSASYLDHINGKYHNRALGMSMRVERSTADDVRCPYPDLPLSMHQGGLTVAVLGFARTARCSGSLLSARVSSAT